MSEDLGIDLIQLNVLFNTNERNIGIEFGVITPVNPVEENENKGIIEEENMSNSEARNIIFFGPPGTGKSHEVGERIKKNTGKEDNIIIRTTFHPEYSYYDFVGQYKPVVGKEKVGSEIKDYEDTDMKYMKPFIYYEFIPGPFIKAVIKALPDPSEKVFLIIEEINRGNCAAIFGDIFQLLDRENDGASKYGIDISAELKAYIEKELKWPKEEWSKKFPKGFTIPSNLYIYATMNTSDQSLFPMDSAFKRRWEMEYIRINYDDDEKNRKNVSLPKPYEGKKWINFIKIINEKIVNFTQSDDKQIGQWFINGEITPENFKGKVLSYLWFDVFRQEPKELFKEDIKTYDDVIEKYDKGVIKDDIMGLIK